MPGAVRADRAGQSESMAAAVPPGAAAVPPGAARALSGFGARSSEAGASELIIDSEPINPSQLSL